MTYSVPLPDAMTRQTITLEVTQVRRTRVRMWLCTQLLKLAALVAPVHLDIRA